MVGLFTISLAVSYEGFQVSPNLRTQHMSVDDVLSSCNQMKSVLQSNEMSYEHLIRLLNNNEINEHLNFGEIDIVKQCLEGKLPELSSYLIPRKIGFFEGIGTHDAKGKAQILTIEKNNYLRLESFEISYESKVEKYFQIPELHAYLSQSTTLSPEIYLDKLKTKLGNKNYKLPDVDLNIYDTVLIFDEIRKEPFVKIKLEDSFYIRDIVNNLANDVKTIDSPKIASQVIYEQYGFFENIGNYNAKGVATIDYEEDEGELEIENFEISTGNDLRLYITENGDVKKSGYWTLDLHGFVYLSNGNTDEILRYSPDGTFKDVFVKTGSGGLVLPTGITFGPDDNLYVGSGNTDEILRYSPDGTFKDVFVKTGSGGLNGPEDLTFGPDDNLYVSSNDNVLRFDGKSGKFLDVFIRHGSGGLVLPTGITFGPDDNLYVGSGNTDEILRYSPDGTFKDVFVKTGSGGLNGPKDLVFSSNEKYLYVASFLTNEILRYGIHGEFVDNIVSSHNGEILNPKYSLFGPDNNLYVSSNDNVLRFDGKSGKFLDVFIRHGSGGLVLPTGITFGPDDNLYVGSGNTDEILRYSPDGTFKDVFVKTGSGGLNGPEDLTFGPDNNLYVSSRNTDEILRYSPDGTFKDVFVNSNELQKPHGITFGPDDNLYVVSTMTDEILRFERMTGQLIDVFASGGGLANPIDISVNSEFFYVSSRNTDEILRYSPDGTFKDVFVNSNELQKPHGITFGPDDNLYVVSNETSEILKAKIQNNVKLEIEKFVTDASSALYQPKHLEIYDNKICVSSYLTNDIHCYDEDTGKSLGKLTVSFNRALISRDNSVVGPDGELYVPDNLRNNILRYDGVTGLFSSVVVNTENDQLFGPSYLTFGPDNNLYVSSDDKIFRFNGDTGSFLDVFVTQNKAGINNPQSLSFDENYLYVNSYDNNRVLRYDSTDGKFIDEFIESRDHKLLGPVGNVVDERGNFYVGSSGTNKILQYNVRTGEFADEILLQNSPHGFVLGDSNIMYISLFDSNEVLSYDLDSKQYTLLLSSDDGLSGPEGLAFDTVNDLLYVSSSLNNKIISHDFKQNISYDVAISNGNGILQKPHGLVVKDGILFISNTDNNEILKYDPYDDDLSIFVQDTGNLIRPGGITFGPNSDLYVINENDDRVYQYDVKKGNLLGVFAESPYSTTDDSMNVGLRSVVFTRDGQYMFASDPSGDNILAYDVKNKKYLDDFFIKHNALNYPTDLILTPDGKYLLAINYGDNIISRFTVSGDFDMVFATPGNDGLTQLSDIRFGHDKNLYVMGGLYDDIFKYDGHTGNYLGEYDDGGTYLGKIVENILSRSYLLNEVNTRQNNIVMIYDHFLEQPYAKIILHDQIEILTPLNIALNSFISSFNIVPEPKLKSDEITKHTGFFVGLNDITAYGQVLTKSIGFTSLITIENFSFDYDENDYVSTIKSKNMFRTGPNLITCIVPSTSELTCKNSSDSIELGTLNLNSGDNAYILHDLDLEKYSTIVVYDTITEKSFASIPLRDYGIFRVSGESFIDWFHNDFAVVPILSIIMMIFPVFFDYTRGAFKILFFTGHLLVRKRKNLQTEIMSNKKITILIPAHNEESGIKESIESALATDYLNKEVIVIDDGSTDKTWLIANSFAQQGLIKLIHRDVPLFPNKSSKASALNHGMNYATGDYVLCMDGDTKLDTYALRNAAQYFDDESTVAFSGNVKILAGDGGVNNVLTKLQTYEYMIAIELGRRFTSMFQVLLVISGAFGIFKKDIIKGVHTFDKDTLTEDFDLTLKFRKTRGKIRFIPESIAYTYCPPNWHTWIAQRNRWAYGQLQTLSKNKNILTSKFPLKDKISFIDMFVLDIILSIIFPIGLTVLGIISIIMFMGDNLHVLVYPLTLVMSAFLILEITVFSFATLYSGKFSNLKLVYLVPVMTFFYRPYLKMINLRAYLRAYFKKSASWD
ncbi:MAG: glycosyltransferase [Nitrosopumilus sp.]|nr:glycosyltransferase [Nitrosopumilus sp.]